MIMWRSFPLTVQDMHYVALWFDPANMEEKTSQNLKQNCQFSMLPSF